MARLDEFEARGLFVVEHCYKCGIAFAITRDFYDRRLKERDTFYCPSGHGQHYLGETEESKLKRQLELERQRVDAALRDLNDVEQQRDQINKSYSKMRHRIKNGVCPCCNRTFQNLLRHMQTEHPDFASHEQLKTLRHAYGLTQTALAGEIGINNYYISNYERGKYVPEYAKSAIELWIKSECA